MTVPIALTVDVEEWFHGPRALGFHVDEVPELVVDSTLPLLELMHYYGISGTFFVVGEVAVRHPEIIDAIIRDGHELGCHGMTHRTLQTLGPEGLRGELCEFRAVVEEIAGGRVDVTAFRAPAFSMNPSTSWAVPILRELGYRSDSSVVPVTTPMYGAAGAPRKPYRPRDDDPAADGGTDDFTEFPLPVFRMGPFRIPCGGGVFFRVIPLSIFRSLLGRSGDVAVFYLHPWETLVSTPHVPGMPWWRSKLRHHGYDHSLQRLDRLLSDRRFAWGSMSSVLEKSSLAALDRS